ncbi:HtaA domain-containing protein, partial [Leucobacter chironomi]|uniref:HtaA domain-containing protein n=1 Tax=Leucobacter chironomi TaxID=491918 RepID=UPI00196A08FC
ASVTVTGSGYDPTKSIYVTPCADIDVADLTFAYINAGCTAGAKLVWAHGAVDKNGLPRALQFDADGSFEVTMTVAPRGDESVTSLFTLRDHNGMTDRSQDAKVVLGFKAPTMTAAITEAGLAGLKVTVAGTGVRPGQSEDGLTVAIVEKGKKVIANGDTVAWAFLPKGAVVGGAFDTLLQAAPSALDRTKQYEVVVLSGVDWSQLSDRKVGATALTVSPENWESIFGPIMPSAQALTSISASGLEIKVSGKQLPVDDGDQIYAAVIEAGMEGELTEDSGYTAFAQPFPTVTHGSVAFTLLATKDKLDRKKKYEVLLWKQHSAPTAETIYARAAVNVTQEQWDQLSGTVVPPAPKPEQPAPVQPAQGAQRPGSLTWGVSGGFADYTTGRAKGSVTGNGVGGGAGGYVFPQAGSAWNAASHTGTVQYSGVVTFTGHAGLMRETFANPVITVHNALSGTITVRGESYALNLAVAAKSVGANGEATWAGAPVAGAISGGGSTGSGAGGGSFGIDPVTFTVGAVSGANYGTTTVSAKQTKRTPAAAPPATTGVTVVTPAKKLVPGGEIEIEASGFESKERDILVVVYSDPIVLDEAAGSDENGTVRWIGTLPEDLEPGTHTITLQGSINAGAVIEVAEKAETVKTEKVKKAATAKVTEQAEPMAAGVLAADEGPVWVWWVAAIALLVVAGATTGLVVVQRRGNAGEK